MEKLLHLTLVFLAAPCVADNVTVLAAVEGDTISVNCSYDPRQWWRGKSWCRQLERDRCQQVLSVPPAWLPFPRARRGSATLRDDASAGLLTVTMRRLRKEDAGLYRCTTEFLGDSRSLRKVRLEVLAAELVTQVPEEPRAVQSISRSPPGVDFSVFYILAGFLVAKFTVAVLLCVVAHSRMKREKGQKASPGEQQELPFPAGLGHGGIGLSRESSA
ncbi:PREDICTED: triggering receptor expressed on myeloid cells 2-like [Sturnus vulgaris]|uniref:triggering receptor expressed on myeloid cells 2-like n=1 Tax=Sturnus vulgaris TaxID=9172 RepID=UPI00071A7000|nr:PREDICTED: triggering receptor expressed on myeloid cells 2-like [Sturnus vulgaris]